MAKRRKNSVPKGVNSFSKDEALHWLYEQSNGNSFESSVRVIAKEWGWATGAISLYLKQLEQQGILKRSRSKTSNKTVFELFETELFETEQFETGSFVAEENAPGRVIDFPVPNRSPVPRALNTLHNDNVARQRRKKLEPHNAQGLLLDLTTIRNARIVLDEADIKGLEALYNSNVYGRSNSASVSVRTLELIEEILDQQNSLKRTVAPQNAPATIFSHIRSKILSPFIGMWRAA